MDKVMELYVRSMVALQTPRKGQGLVEYALIIALVSVVLIAALGVLGVSIQGIFGRIAAALNGAG